MEVQDVSGQARFVQILEGQRNALRRAESRKGQIPSDRKGLYQLVREFMGQYESTRATKRLQSSGPLVAHLIPQSFVPPPYQPSTAAFADLKKIHIKELKLQTHHRGRYLLIKAATPAVQMTAVMAVMEDENGDGCLLQIFHQEDTLFQGEPWIFAILSRHLSLLNANHGIWFRGRGRCPN